jgi:4a-hydroxytetrahydrobiopterin dehydratase
MKPLPIESLSPDAINQYLLELNNWVETEGKIYKRFEFSDFAAAFGFVAKVACLAEKMNHHPDIHIAYNNVTLYLFTHDKQAITNLDIQLAQTIDSWDERKK